jgi:hypothetical protein
LGNTLPEKAENGAVAFLVFRLLAMPIWFLFFAEEVVLENGR